MVVNSWVYTYIKNHQFLYFVYFKQVQNVIYQLNLNKPVKNVMEAHWKEQLILTDVNMGEICFR